MRICCTKYSKSSLGVEICGEYSKNPSPFNKLLMRIQI